MAHLLRLFKTFITIGEYLNTVCFYLSIQERLLNAMTVWTICLQIRGVAEICCNHVHQSMAIKTRERMRQFDNRSCHMHAIKLLV